METLAERTKRAKDELASVDSIKAREQAIVDRHASTAPLGSLARRTAEAKAELEIEARRNQRSVAEKAPPEIVAPTKEMLSNLGSRGNVLEVLRKMTPEQKAEALKIAPGIAQQLGDDRGGGVSRTLGAVSRGISHMVSQPTMELISSAARFSQKIPGQNTGAMQWLADMGGTPEEIEYIRQLDAAASQEFNPALPSDPWYERGPLQAVEMAPWMATIVGGGGLGRVGATGAAELVGTSAASGGKIAGAIQKTGQAIGTLPTKVPVVGKYLPGLTAGRAGELAGITASAFPGQYAQEVDQLKAIGMEDDAKLRLLAGGTAAVVGLIEGLVPNPIKAGPVSLTQGASTAARQYLWEAAKRAPAEMSEEYLQGVTSGLGQHVAQYIASEKEMDFNGDGNPVKYNPVERKSIADAFALGWEQTKEAALPMAFLLGVPASIGAGRAGLQARMYQEQLQPPLPGAVPPTATPNANGQLVDMGPAYTGPLDANGLPVQQTPEQQQEAAIAQSMAALDKPPGAHKWAEIVLGDRTRYKEAPDEATRTKEWQKSRSTATQGNTAPTETPPQSRPWWDFGSGVPEGEIPAPPGLALIDRLTGRSAQVPPAQPSASQVVPPPPPSQESTKVGEQVRFGSYTDVITSRGTENRIVEREGTVEKVHEDGTLTVRGGKETWRIDPSQIVARPGAQTPQETQATPETQPTGAPQAPSGSDAGAAVAGAGRGIVEGLYQSMFDRLQQNRYPGIAKTPVDDAVAAEHSRQPFQTPEEIRQFVNDGSRPLTQEEEAARLIQERIAQRRSSQPLSTIVDKTEPEQTTAPVPQQPKGSDPTVTDAEQVPPSTTTPQGKEPWELTRSEHVAERERRIAEFRRLSDENGGGPEAMKVPEVAEAFRAQEEWSDLDIGHKPSVQKAVKEGKPVPASVLAEYPNIKPKSIPVPAVDAQSKGTAATPTGATVDRTSPAADPVSELDQAEDELAGLLGETTGEDEQASGDVQELPQPKHPDEVDALPKDSLYRTTAGGKKFIAVRGEGKRGGGDRLFETVEAANAHIERQKVIDQQNEEVRKKREEREAAEFKKEADYVASFQGFKQDNPREFGRARKVLDTQRNYRDKVQTRKQIIEQSVADGAKVLGGRLERPDGTSLGEDAITKIGIQYAEHLIAARLRSDAAKADLRGDSEMSEALNRQADKLSNPESKWQSETRAKLDAVPALKGFDMDEEAGTVKVTRPDDIKVTIHFKHDEKIKEWGKKKGFNPEKTYGWAVKTNAGEIGIFVRSDANHTNVLNHEMMHALEFAGIVTKEEVEQYGGREAIAEKYGKWAEVKLRKKDSVFQKIYDALEAVFSSQRKFFEEVGARQAAKPQESLSQDKKPSVPSYRDWRFTSTAKNAGKVIPNKVGAKFLPDQMQAISDWAKSEGYSVSNVLPTGISINDPSGKRLDIAMAGVAGVKAEASKASSERRQANERKADEDRKAKADGRKSAAWIANVFGSDAMNDYNRNALSDYLEGDTKKFEGMVSEKWREGLKSLKALSEEGKIDWKRVLDAYDLDSKNAPAQPSADQVNVDSGAESKVKKKPKFSPGQSVVKVVNGKRSQVWTLDKRAPAGSGFDWYASDIYGDKINLDESEMEAVDTQTSAVDEELNRLSDDDVADKLLDTQTGESLDLPLWRSGDVDPQRGAYYSPRADRSLRYGKKADRARVQLESVFVAETKEEAAKDLGVQAEFYEAEDNTPLRGSVVFFPSESNTGEDPDFLTDSVLMEAAKNQGYDGIVFRMDGMGSPEVYAFPTTQPSADQVNVDSGAESKVKTGSAKLPWLNSSPDQGTNWHGTKVSVAPSNRREEPYSGQVVRVLNRGEMVEVQPDGQDGTFRVDSARITLAEEKPTTAKQSEEPAAESIPEPTIPKFTRTTPDKGSTTRQDKSDRVEKARAEISGLERKRRDKQGEHDKLRSNATKKRAAARKEIAALNSRINVVQGEISSDFASDTLAKLEDELESPRSYDHYIAGMKAIHKLKASVAEDAARRGEMGRDAARSVVSKEEKEADRLDAELQGRAKDIAMSKGFTSGDAEQIALAASNGFTIFEDRSLADIVEVQGKRTRDSRVSQEIGKLKPSSPYGQKDLSNEQVEEFTKQYQEASLDDKGWLAKRGDIDKAVKESINANREASRKREEAERKEKEEEKAKQEQEALANARERAKKYFLDERISKALKKQKPKTKPVKLRQESGGGPVKIVEGKTTDGDQDGELYPNGLILHKTFEEDSKDFVLTHARSGSGFPFSAKKSDMQELIGLLDILGLDFNVDTDEKGALPSELTSRVKKINTAWDNGDYATLSEQDYATVKSLAEVAKTDIDADLILTADDLGANGIPPGLDKVFTDRGLRVVKGMAEEVPEFAYDPVFTVKDGMLLYRDGYEFNIDPTAFNLHPSELKEGQTVGINLEDLGIKRFTPQDVVAEMMKQAGMPRVTKNKGGDVSVGYVGAIPASLQQGKDDNEWNVVGGTRQVREVAVTVLKKIRWRQPGQDGDPKTDIDVMPEDNSQATDSDSQTVPTIQSEEAPTIDPFSERSPESAERRRLIGEAKNEMRPYYQIAPEASVEEGIRNAIKSFVEGASRNARITGGADGKALDYDGSTKKWNAIVKRAQSIADKTNAVHAVIAIGDTKTGIPTHAVIVSSPGFVGTTFDAQNSKPWTWGNTIENLYDGLPTAIVVPDPQAADSTSEGPMDSLPENGYIEGPKGGKLSKPQFEVGERVQVGNSQGVVESVNLRWSGTGPKGSAYKDSYKVRFDSGDLANAGSLSMDGNDMKKAASVEPVTETPKPIPTQAEFMEMSNGVNAPGVKQTIRVTAGERTLLMERSKHDGEWSIREAEKYTGEVKGKTAVKKGGELIVSGIVETKKAKEIAQRIIDGTFDKDADKRFVREDTQSIGLTNAGIAESMKDTLGGRRDNFAKLLREDGLVTDGRFLMKVSDKDRDAILKSVGPTFEGKDLKAVTKMMDDGQKALSRSANAMKPIGYRGGYLTPRTVVLQSQDGDSAIIDKSLHDTILKKYPNAVPYFLEDGKPISYAVDGDLVAIVMPMNMDKPDAKVKALVAGKYDFDAEAAEAAKFPPPQPKTKLKKASEKANKELSKAVDEFGNAIKGKLGMNLPLNPEVIAAAAKVVAKAIQAGTLNFAELMERMVTKYGDKMAERMRGALQQEWDKQVNSNPIAEDGIPPETPQPHPELVQPEPIPLTSVKNAIVDELRIQRGEDPMPDVTPQTIQQWLEAAGNRIANDPYAGNTLVEQLLTGGKTSVDEMEGMLLQYHYRAVNNLFEAADAKLTQAKANGDPAEIAIAQDEARVIMRRLTAIETALDKAGTAWGRAGVSRQIFLKQDFSLASMVRRARVANAGNELSDEQVAIISEQAKQIEDLQKKIAELEAKTVEQAQAKAIDESIKQDIEETKNPIAKPKSKMRLKAEARVASAWKSFGAIAKGRLYSNPIDPELLKPALEVVKAYIDLGMVTFREFMSTAVQNMGAKEAKASEPTFRAAWDQLQEEGETAQPELDLTNPGQLTRFARNVQRTLVENGITDREEVVDGVHEALQEIIPEITRRQAMDALSSYGQFSQLSKDPIDQIIRDINGQLQQLAKLEDMEKGQAPAKTGVERRSPTDEERRLTQLVNEAKRRGGFVVTDPETQLKSAMAAAKTAVKNRIADMNYEIKTGSRVVRNKSELIPDAELEQLRKDRDALQKVHKEMFPPKGATQAQKIAAASRALDAAIANLEAKLAVGDISPAPQPTPLSTPELDAKRARLKALNEQRNALRKIANPNMTDEQIKIRALDRSIAELEKQLATGNFAPKPKPTPLTSPEINARQAKLEELRATKKAILDAANPKMTPEQRASRAYEAHLRKQLATYLEKIAQGDFATKPKKQPRVLTKGELDLKKQLADVKHDFFEALSRYHLENLSPGERAIDIVRESAHLSRAIMTSVDLSAVLRQGGLGVYSHPVMAKKAAGEMWHAIWSREKEFQSMEKLRSRPNAQLYEESGLNITDSEGKLSRQEEAFMGRWARTGIDFLGGKVQAGSKLALEPVAASARAYVTFINNLRADLFDVMVENLGRSGQVTKEEARLIATYVNAATGRADLKALNEKAAALNTVFFAPRYVASRFQYLAMPLYLLGSKDSIRVKKLIAKEYARTFTGAAVFIASLTALSYLAYLASGDDDEKPSLEINPLSADFFKPKIGETRIDPLAGLAQVIVFSSRMLSFHTKSSETGKIKRFYEGGPYETTHGSEAWRFMRTKLAPVPGAAVTAMSGMKDVVGDPVTPAGLVGGLFVPISLGEVYSTMRHRGIPKGTALTVLNIMGASVNTYGPKTAYLDATPEDRAKQVNDYIKHMDWESDLPAFSEYLKPEELKQVQDRQNERRGDLVFEAMGEVKPKKDYKTEVHYEEALERHKKANEEFEEFRKQYAPTYTDALRYLTYHFDNEGGIKSQGLRKAKPSFVERKSRLMKYYESRP